ncbi:MAG TPA: signal peptidase I [Candidatus Dormibacteraeota bacterium]|nr:signal peptidase I [Candidatus Dormibacteraeota bacterium]
MLFFSKTARHANAMRKHVQKLLDHQRDILAPQAVEAVTTALVSLKKALTERAPAEALEKEMDNLEKVADKWLKPYPNAAWRENVEVLLVALAVAMGIRTFILQPFKIPTGSMQPTLFGVTSANLLLDPDSKIPGGLAAVREWFEGVSYIHKKAKVDGTLETIDPPFKILIFNIWQTFSQGGKSYIIWFPPDYGSQKLEDRAGIRPGMYFHNGDDIVKLKVNAGDHLFVDRVSYNFRSPDRGEIIVFETKGIPEENRMRFGIPGDQFYIKRLVALNGEHVSIGNDRHLRINGQRLDAATPHFEKVYSFNPKEPPRDSQYSGHVNDVVVHQYYPNAMINLAPLFPDESTVYNVGSDRYMVMGDNTMNSLDSRSWGDFPSQSVIGKSFFVYWPLSDRFGWGYHR